METSLYARFMALTDQFGLIPEDLLVIPRAIEEESHHHDHDHDHDDDDDEDEQQQQDDGSEEPAEEALPTTPESDQQQQDALDQRHLSPNPIVDLLLHASDNPAILDSPLVDKPDMENGLVELPA